MSDTPIEWTHAPGYRGVSWNPVTGCEHAGRGCKHCYAERMANRQVGIAAAARAAGRDPGRSADYDGTAAGGHWTGLVRTLPHRLNDPLGWKAPCAVFVNSMADLFHDSVPLEFIGRVLDRIAACPQHRFIILTKRARRMRDALTAACDATNLPLPTNIIPGVSVSGQDDAERLVPYLFDLPSDDLTLMVSAEPLCGPLDLTRLRQHFPGWAAHEAPAVYLDALRGRVLGPDDVLKKRVGFVVAGGESGPGASPCHPQWARDLRDQCEAAGVSFLWKSWGAWAPFDDDHGDTRRIGDRTEVEDSGGATLWPDGSVVWSPFQHTSADSAVTLVQVGPKRAGRLLDGRFHDAYPAVLRRE